MTKFKVGEKVRVVDEPGRGWDDAGIMESYCGKVVTISKVLFDGQLYFTEEVVTELGHPLMFGVEDLLSIEDNPIENKPMPKLTTGMFGKDDEGDLFVVVDNTLVYQGGKYDVFNPQNNCNLGDINESNVKEFVVALYEAKCFDDIQDGSADVIWERSETDVKADKKTVKSDALDDILKTLLAIKMLDDLEHSK